MESICCACSILAISVLQFALLQWRSDLNKIQEKNESQRNQNPMMNLIARTPSFVSSSTSVSPVKRYYGNQDPWKSVVAEDRLGQPGKETESFSSTDYSKLDYDRVWSSQGGKLRLRRTIDQGQPDKTSFVLVTRNFFSTEPRNP